MTRRSAAARPCSNRTAHRHYSEAIRIDPNYAEAYSNRDNLFEAKGRREDAIAEFRRALAINPNHERSRDALNSLGAAP